MPGKDSDGIISRGFQIHTPLRKCLLTSLPETRQVYSFLFLVASGEETNFYPQEGIFPERKLELWINASRASLFSEAAPQAG
jgi:hypothetical protein